MTVQSLLEAITALSAAERAELLARLREIYGSGAPAPSRQLALGLGGWEGPADFVVVFDGGSQGNPGAGYGSYAVFDRGGAGQVTRASFDGALTNNEAEYLTLLAALRALTQRLGGAVAQTSVEVRGDSSLVIEQVSGSWKAKDERMRALRDDVRGLLQQFRAARLVQQPRADTVRVLGH
jgi:probable phosphoglycerate mutase